MTAQSETRDEELESLICHEEVRLLYENMPFSLMASTITSVTMFIVLYGHTESTRLLVTWITLMILIVIFRGLDTWQYFHSDTRSQKKETWGTRLLIGTASAGFGWGALPWFGHSTGEYQALIVIAIVGIAGGSMSTYSYRWQTIAYFLIPALGFLELKLLFEKDTFSTTVSFLLLVFILFTLSVSRKIYKNTNQNVRLRIEADFRELALIEAKEEAERANYAKSSFLSSMSHDLRTPLNAILGFSQLIEYDTSISKAQRANTLEIIAAGKHLLELVNQILDLAKIEEGSLYVHVKQIWLDEVLSDCQSLIKPLANEKQIQLQFDSCLDGYVNADKTRFKQVLLNLLSNAIKYNHHFGKVSLRCNQVTENRIRIEIEDNGIGISSNMQHRLFQPFSRLESESQKTEGTGIGLSIAKHLTQLMDGEIGFSSEFGNGSTFWVEFDGGVSHAIANRQPRSNEDENDTPNVGNIDANSSIKILVAEDNLTNRKLIASQLNVLGYHYDLVGNGREALALHEKHNYSMILTDCNMPIMDGYQFASAVRRAGDNSTPIIALTADAFPESEIKCRNSGMSDRMVKPVTLKRLKATLRKWHQAARP